MHAFLLDEGLAMRMTVEAANRQRQHDAKLPKGLRLAGESDYDDPLPAGPVVPGPAAHLHVKATA